MPHYYEIQGLKVETDRPMPPESGYKQITAAEFQQAERDFEQATAAHAREASAAEAAQAAEQADKAAKFDRLLDLLPQIESLLEGDT
jgi:hypothetical protein